MIFWWRYHFGNWCNPIHWWSFFQIKLVLISCPSSILLSMSCRMPCMRMCNDSPENNLIFDNMLSLVHFYHLRKTHRDLFDKVFYKKFQYYFFIGVSFIPLFLIGYDWGRWIYIILICFLVVYLTSEKDLINKKFLFIFPFYPLLFRIEHCCKPLIHFQENFVLNNLEYLLSIIESIY